MIYFLTPSLLVLFFACYKLNKNDIISPACLFTLSFLFSSIWATAYAGNWDLELLPATFLVIFGGVSVFIIVAKITSFLIEHVYIFNKYRISQGTKEDVVYLPNWELWLLVAFQVVTIFLSAVYVTPKAGISSVSQAIGLLKAQNALSFPTILSLMRFATYWLSFWMCYVFSKLYITTKKISIVQIIIIILGMVSSVFTGGRSQVVNIAIAFFMCFCILYNRSTGKKISISFKLILGISVLLLLIMLVFRQSLNLLGRTTVVDDTLDYLAMYCGAEIKNLDTYLMTYKGPNASGLFDAHTFNELISWLGHYFGVDNLTSINVYRYVNGYALGNVHTTFYSFIYDFGYIGMVILTSLMAIISQTVYEFANRPKRYKAPNLCVILYGYIASSLVMSFFSNRFYEQNFSVIFFRGIIVLILFNFFFVKIRFKISE